MSQPTVTVEQTRRTVTVEDSGRTVVVPQAAVRVVTAGTQGPPGQGADTFITAEGDLIIGGTGGTPEALAIGAKNTEVISTGARARYARRRQVYVENYAGYVGDAQQKINAAITSGTTTLTAGGFVADDVGKTIVVAGAGAAGAPLTTTIAAFVSATEVTLADAAATTVSGVDAVYGNDDTAAVQAAQDDAGDTGELWFPENSKTLLTASITRPLGAMRLAWRGIRCERGANSLVQAIGTYHSALIFYRPADESQPLIDMVDGTAVAGHIGPFVFADLAFSLRLANGFRFGDPALGTNQRFVFGVRFERCAIHSEQLSRALGPNGEVQGDERWAISITRGYECEITSTSIRDGWGGIQMPECDSNIIDTVRIIGTFEPFFFTSAGPSPAKKLTNVQIEGYVWTPLRIERANVVVDGLTFEPLQYGDVDHGRYPLTGVTCSVTAGSHALTFSASMDQILWPGRSLIEVTDGTNTDTALVATVAGTDVTVYSDLFAFDWTAAAATVTRIHGYGPIKIGELVVAIRGGGASRPNCPTFVMAHALGQMAISDAGGALANRTSLVVANRYGTSADMRSQMTFSNCGPGVIADPAHPLVHVDNWRPHHGLIPTDSPRPHGGDLADEAALLTRRWYFTPKSGLNAANAQNERLFRRIAGDEATAQTYWAWAIPGGTIHRYNDETLPSEADTLLRVRLRARAKTTGGTLTVQAEGTGFLTTLLNPTLTTDLRTFQAIVPVPNQWLAATGRTVGQGVQIRFTHPNDWFLVGCLIEDIGPMAAVNPDTSGALLAELETEINELKAALRTAGIIQT